MAKFPKGNQFWKLRSEHGRDTLFATPALMWEAATEYFNWCDAHPWYKVEANKSAGKTEDRLIKVPIQRPYTLSGFLLYAGASESYLRAFRKTADAGFLSVIGEIEAIVETHQLEGATVGVFNSNIVARKLGLQERVDATLGNKKDPGSETSIPFSITLNL